MAEYNSYDRRLKVLVIDSGDVDKYKKLGIPRTTLRSWIAKGVSHKFITLDIFDEEKKDLCQRIISLENIICEQQAIINIHKESKVVLQQNSDWVRFPKPEIKEKIVGIYNSVSEKISPAKCAEAIGISLKRLKSWQSRLRGCDLEDYSSCPKLTPTKATDQELKIMEAMVTGVDYLHFSINALALYAAKIGKLYFSSSTWHRYIKKFKWKKSKQRKYRNKDGIGIRASEVNQIWHIDISVMKLIDNTKVYVQAIIDNYSRYIVAWNVFARVTGENTKELLRIASESLPVKKVKLLCDAGVENRNDKVDDLLNLKDSPLDRIIAQVDIHFSNSMIEAFFRSMKNNYLYYQDLTTVEVFKNKIGFYVHEYNIKIPHPAHNGATPAEIFNGTWDESHVEKLKASLKEAYKKRIQVNQNKASCRLCLS